MYSLRLKPDEQTAIKSRWRDNPVMKSFYGYCTAKRRTLRRLEYEPEEVFYACFVVLDNIKMSKNGWHGYVDGLGERMRECIRDGLNVPDEELWMACCEVLTIVIIILLLTQEETALPYSRIIFRLLDEIGGDGALRTECQSKMHKSVPETMWDELKHYSTEYMKSDQKISDEIAAMMEGDGGMRMLREEEEEFSCVDERLLIPEAQEIFRKLRAEGLLDKENMPMKKLTWPEKGIIAYVVAERIGIVEKWSVFQKAWRLKSGETLRSNYNKALKTQKGWDFLKYVQKLIS